MNATQSAAAAAATPGEGERPSRREQLRQMTLEEITTAARTQLTRHGVQGLSLRAVAREVGLTPSAIYRYFDSHDALVAAVGAASYADAARTLDEAAAHTAGRPTHDRLTALFAAYRQWAFAHPAEFQLLFGTDRSEPAGGAAHDAPAGLAEFYATPIEVLLEGLERGEVEPASPGTGDLTKQAAALAEQLTHGRTAAVDEAQLVALLTAWAGVHGFVALELFGRLDWFLADRDACFATHLDGVLRALGVVRA